MFEIYSKINKQRRLNDVWRRSGAFIVNFEHIWTHCSGVSIVDFEQVNARRVLSFLNNYKKNGVQKVAGTSYVCSVWVQWPLGRIVLKEWDNETNVICTEKFRNPRISLISWNKK